MGLTMSLRHKAFAASALLGFTAGCSTMTFNGQPISTAQQIGVGLLGIAAAAIIAKAMEDDEEQLCGGDPCLEDIPIPGPV